MLFDNCDVDKFAAIISPTNGMEIFPSGRTGTEIDNSVFLHTLICSASPTPIRYSSNTPRSEIGGIVTFLLLLHAARSAHKTMLNQESFFIQFLLEARS